MTNETGQASDEAKMPNVVAGAAAGTTPTPSASSGTGAPRWTFPRWAQIALAVVSAFSLVFLLYAIGLQIAATQPGSAPARIERVQAGPYPLTVSLYKDPADAGYAMPIAIAPSQPVQGHLTYTVSSIPGPDVDATSVNASLGPNARIPNGVRGTVEITVQGDWYLQIVVSGPDGEGFATIPITARPAVVIPLWVAWPVGLLPALGIALFILAQRRRAETTQATDAR